MKSFLPQRNLVTVNIQHVKYSKHNHLLHTFSTASS